MTLSTTELVAIVIIVVSTIIAIGGMALALSAYKASDDVSADALNVVGDDADRKKRKVAGSVLASLGGAGIIAGAVIYFASGGNDARRHFDPVSGLFIGGKANPFLAADSDSDDSDTRDTFAHQAAKVVGERVEEQTGQPFVPQLTEATREKLNNDIAVNNLMESINAKKAEFIKSVFGDDGLSPEEYNMAVNGMTVSQLIRYASGRGPLSDESKTLLDSLLSLTVSWFMAKRQ